MKIYYQNQKISISYQDLMQKFHTLKAIQAPILFYAELSITPIELIIFCYLEKKSFFPLHPLLPFEKVKYYQKIVGGIYFDIKKQTIEKCHNKPCLSDSHVFMQTSGSSAEPKVAALSFESLYYSALGSIEFFSLTQKDIWHLSLPLYHMSGLMPIIRMIESNGSIELNESLVYSTHISVVPTQLYRNSYKYFTNKNLKAILCGGAALNLNIIEKAKNTEAPLYLSYGMTEAASTITCGLYSLGHLLPYRKMTIDSKLGIMVKGKILFTGYVTEKGIKKPFTNDGFFCTKDLGALTSEQGLVIYGRKDRQFISGGENIQPEYIEKVLIKVFNLQRCKVVGKKCSEFGMVPIAYTSPPIEMPSFEIKQALKPYLLPYQIPKEFFLAHSPKNFKD